MKKILAFLLTLAFVGSLSIATTGCGKKADEKKTTPPADKKEADKKT